NTEGGVNAEQFRCAAVVDRVNTTMQVWMAATIGCAQCHNHKYDPFSQKEYYQLYAIFNNCADANGGDDAPTVEVARMGMHKEFAGAREKRGALKTRGEEEGKKPESAEAEKKKRDQRN